MTSAENPEWPPAQLAALHTRCFSVPRPWSEAEFVSLLEMKGTFLVEQAEGFALGRVIAGEAELLTLAVAPEHRNRGAGKTLVQAYHDQAREHGASESFLEVAQDNAAAIHLYVRAGYTESGRRRNYYRAPNGNAQDALLFRKSL